VVKVLLKVGEVKLACGDLAPPASVIR